MANLYNTESPVDRAQRNNVNNTWKDILLRFSNLQRQINILAGGAEVDELLQSIQDAINRADTSVALAIEANNTATQEAIANNNAALQTALNTVSDTLVQLNTAIENANVATDDANTATTNANNARDAALKAVQDVTNAISTMQTSIQAYKDSFEHTGPYQNAKQYRKNNEVYHQNGSTYRAKKDTLGNPPPTQRGLSNEFWQLVARGGDDAPESSLFGVWRGPTPPANKQMLWWFDDTLSQGYETQIWVGPTAPDNTNVLWLNTGGA